MTGAEANAGSAGRSPGIIVLGAPRSGTTTNRRSSNGGVAPVFRPIRVVHAWVNPASIAAVTVAAE